MTGRSRAGGARAHVGLAMAVFLAGCGTLPNERAVPNGSSLTPIAGGQLGAATVDLPTYYPGDRFVFDDGRIEEVVEVDGERVTWETNGRARETRYRNFALPRLAWQNAKSEGTAEVTTAATALWPLQPGGSERFVHEYRRTPRETGQSSSKTRIWDCSVESATKVLVPAGQFDTYPVVCARYSGGRSGVPRITRRWYYAPALGHYVRFEQYGRYDLTKLRKLVERGFGEDVDPDLAGFIQRSLERNRSNEHDDWQSTDGTRRVAIVPTRTLVREDGAFCRDFSLEVTSDPASRWERTDRACRSPEGRWVMLDDSG